MDSLRSYYNVIILQNPEIRFQLAIAIKVAITLAKETKTQNMEEVPILNRILIFVIFYNYNYCYF